MGAFGGKGRLLLSLCIVPVVVSNVTLAQATTYDVTIEFSTGNPDHPKSIEDHVVTQETSSSITASVASDPRKTGQYTGWNLKGFGATITSGDAVPAVGDTCPNGDLGDCVVTAVTLISSSGGLYVSDSVTGDGPAQIY